jgi:hypothetical protein
MQSQLSIREIQALILPLMEAIVFLLLTDIGKIAVSLRKPAP